MKFDKMHWLGLGVGCSVAVGSLIAFGLNKLSYFLLVVSLVIALLPFMINFLLGEGRQKEKDEMFIAFSRDLVETVRSGTPIGRGIANLRNRNYGTLTPHIVKLANQLSMGITLTVAFRTFAVESKSKVISRAVGLISEAERAGGKIESVLDSVATSVSQIEQLRKERKASVSNLVTQGYLIFFVFIIIMLVLEFKILPLVSDLQGGEGLALQVSNISSDTFAMPLFVMLLVQSFFAGLVIGKISEGSVKDGIKHSFILIAITLLVVTGARVFFG